VLIVLEISWYLCNAARSADAANRPHREVTTKRVTSFTRSDQSDLSAADNHMDGKMSHGQFLVIVFTIRHTLGY